MMLSGTNRGSGTGVPGTGVAKNKSQYLIVGLGASGLSCLRFLQSQGHSVNAVDSRDNPPGLDQARKLYPEIQIGLGEFRIEDFESADEIVLSPGVAADIAVIKQAREKGIPCYGDIELFVRHAKAPIFAVTGSNGKSTTVSLLTAMLCEQGKRVELGGNIGVPALDLLKKPVPDYYVLELSSFQLDTTDSLHAHAAVVLNVTEDHMDRYADIQQYSHSKFRIYNNAKHAVVNIENRILNQITAQARQCISYRMSAGPADVSLATLKDQCWIKLKNELVIDIRELKIAGKHNVENALAAIALASSAGVSRLAMVNALRKFKGLDHRMQWLAEKDGIRWFNDSKGTNVGATVAAITGVESTVVLIAGGQAKGADLSALHQVVCQKARAVVLIGEDAQKIERALQGCVIVKHAADMDAAVAKAAALAQAGDVVLLSPACASFDMFDDYMHRGKCFTEAVNRYLRQ